MHDRFTKCGGAQLGWVNASWPLARLFATPEKLTIAIRLLGTYSFTPDEVSSVERYVWIPLLASGIRIRHHCPNCPQRVIFWSHGDPEEVVRGIRDSGFVPKTSAIDPAKRPIPIRWSAIIGAILVWNGLFLLPSAWGQAASPTAGWLDISPLFAAFGLAIGTLRFGALQRLILKPGRMVGEIRPFLRLLVVISGILSVVFSILVATGELKRETHSPEKTHTR